MSRQPKSKPEPVPSETEIETSALDLSVQSLEAEAKTSLTPLQLTRLKKIAYYVSKIGLPLNEACILVDVDFDKFEEERKLNPLIDKIIRMKELEFKKDMLHVVTQQARSGDDKMAMALLEKRFPDEFGDKKRGKPGDNGGDMILEAYRIIKKGGDASPLVQAASGVPIVVRRSSASKGVYERIGDIMGNSVPSRVFDAQVVTQEPQD